MRKILHFALVCCFCIGVADAAVRDQTAVNRSATQTSRSAVTQVSAVRPSSNRNATTSGRESTGRNATNTTNVSRSTTSARSATTQTGATSRSATSQTTTVSSRGATTNARSATKQTSRSSVARNATDTIASSSYTGGGYNACRDAYFTCMDQFCAKSDDTYRRCICSSRLEEIKSKERALAQASEQLQNFHDLNLDAINKSSSEVKAMLNASDGEFNATKSNDKSASAQQLAGISAVLSNTKAQALSTQGKLDIAGDINTIWSTTDLAGGADIANLTGESLYNAVHSQCVSFITDTCGSQSTVNMVVAAYGMYIENDCSAISNSLAKKKTEASATIRATEREMNTARLENYNEHNSTAINDCIAQVRTDITSDTACGKNFVHCLDITGQYLNRDTGEPIYTSIFYQLDGLTSLSGDVVTNQTNRLLVAELNRKRDFAERGLDTCRDIADDVWDEFMRQAIAEIYQEQQSRIRQVKNECIDVVNECYDTQSKSLKDFSNIKEQLLLGSRLELSEQMCRDKLDACSNLYGGGDTGLTELITTMQNITDQKIAQNCAITLEEYVQDICSVPSSDIIHSFPFACRTYAPGEQRYAGIAWCNAVFTSTSSSSTDDEISGITGLNSNYFCPVNAYATYHNCNPGYFMAFEGQVDTTPKIGNRCLPCRSGYVCPGGTQPPIPSSGNTQDCGDTYAGSLYQKLVRYAMQTCVRPSQASDSLPSAVLADVNVVMDKVRGEMGTELARECERLGGTWFNTPWAELSLKNSGYKLHSLYQTETSANNLWGSCVDIETTTLMGTP
ncbi:hypothetical protein LJC18_00050 [Lachnospiraceae bacterium OttesenSCG-928-E19]|nr:hypothetical protein [Lachnospiraceae bacterium OttesenSCG-928-E19]